MHPDFITIEIARLTKTSTEWERRFKTYDRLQDAGLSCEEAARIACADMEPEPLKEVA